MLDKIDNYIKLTRLLNPTGYLLLFFPCAFSILANLQQEEQLFYLVTFFLGSIIMRSAGCIINDLADKHIDALVARTENRPLARKAISTAQAITLLGLLLLCGLVILLSLPTQAWLLGVLALIMVALYPFMKRITYWPQLFLGLTFNLGALFASIALTHTITEQAMYIYIGCVFWTLGYDTIYGYMDHKDDITAGVKSLSLYLIKKPYKFYLACFYIIFIMAISYDLVDLNTNSIWIIALAAICLMWQIITLDITKPTNCLRRFKSNNIVGLIISAAYFITYM